MSVKSKVLAAAASLALVGGAGATGVLTAGVANAATPSCGDACVNIFSDVFGDSVTGHPGFLMDSFKQGVATGTPIILFRESNNDPAEDFVFEDQGTVSDFYAAGLIGPAVALHYGCIAGTTAFPDCPFSPWHQAGSPPDSRLSKNANLEAFEVEYAPYGASTGQCVGVAATPTQGEQVTLQPCGVSAKTVWIVDMFDGALGAQPFGKGVPLINGAGQNFSHPFVLTYPSSGYPTDHPRPIMFTANLTGHFTGIFPLNSTISADVESNQIWDAFTGPVQI